MIKLILEQAKAVIESRANFTRKVEWLMPEDGSGRKYIFRWEGDLNNRFISF